MVSAVLLRSVELISSFIEAARSLPSTVSTECLNCAIVIEIVAPRCSWARPLSAWVAASFSRSTMVSRNTITVRAISPISSCAWVAGMRAVVSPSASRFITPARPLSGRVMLRPISQEKPKPSATMAMPTAMMPMRVLACEEESAAAARAAAPLADAMIASARGSIFWLSISMSARRGLAWSLSSIQCAKVSA